MKSRTRYNSRRRGSARRGGRYNPWIVALLCALSLVLAGLIVRVSHRMVGLAKTRLTMDEARTLNASIPYVAGRLAPAKSFRFRGSPAGRAQAAQCLATAALYEAGDDMRGQQAVIQVILNRVQRPQYPKTVCGVVYQGAELASGCQFSFTCDNSLGRRPEHKGWQAARHAAQRALSGFVYRPVGAATHYHADWIVPYWAQSMDKIARVNSHLFYRPRSTVSGDPGSGKGLASASPSS